MTREFSIAFLLTLRLVASPVISEFLASNSTGISDENDETSDWIEIHNPTKSPIHLDGWHLTDDASGSHRWTFPDTILQPDEHLVIFASDKNRAVAGAELHTNFKLSSKGEYLALLSPVLEVVSSFDFPAQVEDISYGLTASGNEITLISQSDPAKALVPSLEDDSAIGITWRDGSATFDDSTWQSGSLGVGFERSSGFEDDIGIDIEASAWGINSSVYLRVPTGDIPDPADIVSLTLRMKYDDGFAAFLNGSPVASANAPANLTWNSDSDGSVTDLQALKFQDFDLTSAISSLKATGNILAIHGLNQFSNSGDFLIRPELIATLVTSVTPTEGYFSIPTPGARNPASNTLTPVRAHSEVVFVSEPSGVKTTDLTVTLTTETSGLEIRYTLDGSDPTATSSLYSASLSITTPTRLRARSFDSGKIPGPSAVADYSFLDPSLLNYLSDVPVIVMDNFAAGDYPNKGRSNDGRDVMQVPRQANVLSIFNPSTNGRPFTNPVALETRSGCRVRGSSSSQFTRKPLSVEFWDETDDDLDLSPFGMAPEADWVLNAPNPTFDRSLIHNPVSLGFAKMIGAHAAETKVVVVFQNTKGGKITLSDLAGVYIFSEKIERKRMGVDFDKLNADGTAGGWMLNIDRMESIPEGFPANTIQPNFHAAGPNGRLEIPDDQQNSGGSQSVDDISEFYHSYLNFHSPDGYEILTTQRSEVQARTRAMDGAVWSGNFTNHLDSESWARAFAVHNFAKNQDAHVLSTYIYQDAPGAKIKMGPVWDFDRAYTWKGGPSDTPLWATDRDWYHGLFQNTDFRQIHQDIWQETRNSTATDAALEGLVNDAASGLRADQISASGLNFSTWQNRISELRNWVVSRANYLDRQYEALPTISPSNDLFVDSINVTLSPTSGGTVYYTTDGSDPRQSGGDISPTALTASNPLTLTGRTILIIRTRDGSRWSGPVTRQFNRDTDVPQLVISEIHYHPSDPTPAEIALGFTNENDFEFLELTNIGTGPADLTNLRFNTGIVFDFTTADISTVAPGERILLVKNKAAFESRHGTELPVAGEYTGSLSNSGETLAFGDQALALQVQEFSYLDTAPWPTCADGEGFSLVLKNPFQNPDHNLATNWRCSTLPGGKPGTSDTRPAFTGDPLADLDNDSLDSLLEHFLGTSDTTPNDATDLLQLGTTLVDTVTYPTFQITSPIGSDDLTPIAEWSQNLQTWSAAPAQIIPITQTPNNDGTITHTYRSTVPIFTESQFFRLKVSQ